MPFLSRSLVIGRLNICQASFFKDLVFGFSIRKFPLQPYKKYLLTKAIFHISSAGLKILGVQKYSFIFINQLITDTLDKEKSFIQTKKRVLSRKYLGTSVPKRNLKNIARLDGVFAPTIVQWRKIKESVIFTSYVTIYFIHTKLSFKMLRENFIETT